MAKTLVRTFNPIVAGGDRTFRVEFPLAQFEVAEIAEVRLTAGGGMFDGSSTNAFAIVALFHGEDVLANPPNQSQVQTRPDRWYMDGWWAQGANISAAEPIVEVASLKTPYPIGWFIGGDQFGMFDNNATEGLTFRLEVWYYRVVVPLATKLSVLALTVAKINPRDQR